MSTRIALPLSGLLIDCLSQVLTPVILQSFTDPHSGADLSMILDIFPFKDSLACGFTGQCFMYYARMTGQPARGPIAQTVNWGFFFYFYKS